MASQIKIKTAIMVPKDHNVLRVLNRSIKCDADGIVHESDHRRACRLIEELGLTDKQTVSTPATAIHARHARRNRASSGMRRTSRRSASAG